MFDTFAVLKIERLVRYFSNEFGYKKTHCVACNGSGYYDNTNSPFCASCDGKGFDTDPTEKTELVETLYLKELSSLDKEDKLIENVLMMKEKTSDIFKIDVRKLSFSEQKTYLKACSYHLAFKKYKKIKESALLDAKERSLSAVDIWNKNKACFIYNFKK